MPPKPYPLGGAGGVVTKWENFPPEGMALEGLGGVTLTQRIKSLNPECADETDPYKLVARTNPGAVWDHPTKADIFEFVAQYCCLRKGWDVASQKYDVVHNPWRVTPSLHNFNQRLIELARSGVIPDRDYVGHKLIKD
ncbi:hypothetical protein COY95_01205, partial [Candidatus Woesearchaeota archaeon CG_4_10_14_0_8_um_filter_47_5]